MQATHPRFGQSQIYTGDLENKDPISSQLPRIGQASPVTREHYMLRHGRFFSGLGTDVSLNDPFPGKPNAGDMEYGDNEAMDDLEAEDDVAGSGIFDAPGRRSTIHSTLGVFADHPSIPGYIAREQPFAVSKDVTDPVNGADVVYIPAGGMTYVERGGRAVDYLDRAESVPPPAIRRRHYRGGGGLTAPAPEPSPTPAPTTPLLPPSSEDLAPLPAADAATDAPPAAAGYGALAFAPSMFQVTRPGHALPIRSIVSPLQLRSSIGDAAAAAQPAPPDWKTYAAVGAIVGVAAAIFVGTVNLNPGKKRKKGRRH